MTDTAVHIYTGGPKQWYGRVRHRWQRQWLTWEAASYGAAYQWVLTQFRIDDTLVEGDVGFTQEYYDPTTVWRVEVSRR